MKTLRHERQDKENENDNIFANSSYVIQFVKLE